MNNEQCEAEVREDNMFSGIRCSRRATKEVDDQPGPRKRKLCTQHYKLKLSGGTVYFYKRSW